MRKLRLVLALFLAFAMIAAACGDDDDDTASGDDGAAADDGGDDGAAADGGGDDGAAADDGGDDGAAADDGGDDGASGDDGAASDDGGDDGSAPVTCGSNTDGDMRGVDKDAGVITLGTTLPFTGVAAAAGEGLRAGIEIAINEVNANGGIDGCTFTFEFLDDRFEVETLVQNARRLIDQEEVWAMPSPAGSQAIPGTYEFLQNSGVIMWAPVSPKDSDIQQVYLLGPTRTEQLRICIDYFAEQGVTSVAGIGQNNELGEEAEAALEMQTTINGMENVGFEEVEVESTVVQPAVLSILDSNPGGIITGVDNAQNALILNLLDENGYEGLMCADNGGGGTGGQNTVGAATPEAADGFLGTLQQALPEATDVSAVAEWKALADAYDGPGSDGAPNFSLQTYYYTRAFFEVVDALEGDYSYENFHAVAESLVANPLDFGAIPLVACGPLPGGHSCASGAGLAEYDSETGTWVQIRDFLASNS